jgi:adenylate cyclase
VLNPSLLRRRHREVVTIVAAALALTASVMAGSGMGWVDGFLYDLSLAIHPIRPGTGGAPVAMIAVDQGSLDSEDLAATPRVFFGPLWAKLIDGLAENGVKAIGFDIIFTYSADLFKEDYDLAFHQALARFHDRLVLARSAGSRPAPPIAASVYDVEADAGKDEPSAIAYVELTPDGDGVQRRVTVSLRAGSDRLLPTLSAALIARAKGSAMPESLLLAPAAPLEAIPTYRLIDVLHCLDRDPTAVRAAFSGNIVLIGSNLAEEDRTRTPDRFMQPPRPTAAGTGACSLGRLGASDSNGGSTPGVFVHAAAVQSVLTGNIVRPVPVLGRAAAAMLASVGGTLLGFGFSPWIAAVGAVALAITLFILAVALLGFGFWFPVAVPAAAAIASMVLAYLVRFLVEERRRRRVQNAFNHYLAPSIVEKLVEDDTDLRLGGELREVTVMFADLSGFTALSGKLEPAELMEVTNAYLQLLVGAVESTGGYVDSFIGDAVMGIWGAPVASSDHAASAARAALAAVDSVMRAKTEADAEGVPGYAIKIGLNTVVRSSAMLERPSATTTPRSARP